MSDHIDNEERRKFIRSSLSIIPAVSLTSTLGMPTWANAATEAVDLGAYQPVFFNAEEWKFLLAACDRLIPAEGEGPGALEAHVPIFIDRQMEDGYGHAEHWYMEGPHFKGSPDLGFQYSYTPRDIYQLGISLTQKYCQQSFGKAFEALSQAQQVDVLSLLETGDLDFSALGEEWLTSNDFFSHLLSNTKEGYFADPIYGGNYNMASWKMIGFPGARAAYTEWVDIHNVKYPLGPVSLNGDRG